MRTAADVAGFEAAFRTLMPYAFNVGWKFFGRREMAEDVAQETMTRAYVVWPKVREHPKPEAWVTTTALHVALELSRRDRRAQRPTVDQAVVPDGTSGVVAVDELRRAMGKLSTRQQQVLLWRYYFDSSVSETAEALGLTESKVKDATHEATTKLAKLLPRSEGARP